MLRRLYALLARIISISGFVFALNCTQAAVPQPILVSAPNSTRAIALEAVDLTLEPFSARPSQFLYGPGQATRIMLFVMNLSLQPGEDLSVVTADAEDGGHHHYNLKVVYIGKTTEQSWLSVEILELDQNMGDVGDLLIQTTYRGVSSNRVRIGVGHIGGGPADDSGAHPTPAPPYVLSGHISLAGAPFSGVALVLNGGSSGSIITDDGGGYSFTITSVGDFIITPSKRFFTFTPSNIFLSNLSNSQTINFAATRQAFEISGVVKDDQGNALNNVTVRLESSSGGPPARTVATSSAGSFSFPDVPAGYDYVVTPANTNLQAFTSQSLHELSGATALAFGGTLRSYTISGSVIDREHHGVSGVTLTISGSVNRSTTTDIKGTYNFTNLPAGRDYSVTAARTDCFVNPGPQTFNLLKDETADFTAIRFYIIHGKVSDGNGKGIMGTLMSLNGPESASMRTPSDGSYSFTVTTPGDYLLTPSREQDLYQFSPPHPQLSITDNQTVNFTGNIVINSPAYVLDFDGTQKTVDYGIFWPQDEVIGHFFWELWAMPGENTYGRYLLTDGYGGAHCVLFGFYYPGDGSQASHYSLIGNIWDGSKPLNFGGDDGPSPGEWGHYAVGWDGQNIITYYDGVPVGKVPFAGPRRSLGTGWGATMLLIGGSDHQNLIGRIAQVRGFEDNNPHENKPESAFAPQTLFSTDGQLTSYYFKPSDVVADLSSGYRGSLHNGGPRGFTQFYFAGCEGCPKPQFVIDPTAPDFSNLNSPGHANTIIDNPPPPPNGARAFDSFSRDNSTYILNGKGGLGALELGSQYWQTNVSSSQPQPFGILAGRAVLLADTTALAWIPMTGAANLDIRVNRTRGTLGSGSNTGMCFRVVDANNFYFAYTHNDALNPSGAKRLTLGYYQNGALTILTDSVTIPTVDWYTLRVVTMTSGVISVYAGKDLIYSTNNLFAASAASAGLFNCCSGMGLQNRWDNFTILNAQ